MWDRQVFVSQHRYMHLRIFCIFLNVGIELFVNLIVILVPLVDFTVCVTCNNVLDIFGVYVNYY